MCTLVGICTGRNRTLHGAPTAALLKSVSRAPKGQEQGGSPKQCRRQAGAPRFEGRRRVVGGPCAAGACASGRAPGRGRRRQMTSRVKPSVSIGGGRAPGRGRRRQMTSRVKPSVSIGGGRAPGRGRRRQMTSRVKPSVSIGGGRAPGRGRRRQMVSPLKRRWTRRRQGAGPRAPPPGRGADRVPRAPPPGRGADRVPRAHALGADALPSKPALFTVGAL